jgi:hypothetical protein
MFQFIGSSERGDARLLICKFVIFWEKLDPLDVQAIIGTHFSVQLTTVNNLMLILFDQQ